MRSSYSLGRQSSSWHSVHPRAGNVIKALLVQEAPTNNRGGVATSSSRPESHLQKHGHRTKRSGGIAKDDDGEPSDTAKSLEWHLIESSKPHTSDHGALKKQKSGKAVKEDSIRCLAETLTHSNQPVDLALKDEDLSGRELHRLLDLLVQRHQGEKAVTVLHWAENQPKFREQRALHYSKTMASLSTSSSAGALRAVKLRKQMQAAGIPLDLLGYNTLLNATGKAGLWAQTLDVFEEMVAEGEVPDVVSYTTLIKACQTCGNRWKQALHFLERMQSKGVAPNAATYTTAMSCCQRAGKWEVAVRIFEDMVKAGVPPDLKAYNSVISACARGAQWEHAWELWSSMRRAGCLPDIRTYNAVISACERSREPQRALEAYRKLQREAAADRKLRPSSVTFNTLISACGKGGLYETAMELYEEMQRQGHQPDSYTLSSLIMACKMANYWEEALELVKDFKNLHGVRLNTVSCNALIATLGRAGRWQYAMQYFNELAAGELDGRPDSWSYTALALAYRAGEQSAKVLDVYGAMRRRKMPVYRDVYYAVLEACERLGLWQEGRAALAQMQEDMAAGRRLRSTGLDMAAWQAVFAFPPLMESVPKPLISVARAAVGSGRQARRLVNAARHRGGRDPEDDADS